MYYYYYLAREYSRERTRYLRLLHVLLLLSSIQQKAPLISCSPSSWLSKVGLNIGVPFYIAAPGCRLGLYRFCFGLVFSTMPLAHPAKCVSVT
jgi:hypothetical protein